MKVENYIVYLFVILVMHLPTKCEFLCEEGYFPLFEENNCGTCPLGTFSNKVTKKTSPFCQKCEDKSQGSKRIINLVKTKELLIIDCFDSDNKKYNCDKEIEKFPLIRLSKNTKIIMSFNFTIINKSNSLLIDVQTYLTNRNERITVLLNKDTLSLNQKINNLKKEDYSLNITYSKIDVNDENDSYVNLKVIEIEGLHIGPPICFDCPKNKIVDKYNCSDCPIKTKPNLLFNNCISCVERKKDCEFCPPLTEFYNDSCRVNQKIMFSSFIYFINSGFYNKIHNPILGRNKEEYIISPFNSFSFNTNDYDYTINTSQVNGFIFKINYIDNLNREVINIGQHIESVKILPYLNIVSKNNKISYNKISGLLIKYSNSDNDLITNLFIMCSNNDEFEPIEVYSEDENKYFIWKTKQGCSLCKDNIMDFWTIKESLCEKNKIFYTYRIPDYCQLISDKYLVELTNVKPKLTNPHAKVEVDSTLSFKEEDLIISEKLFHESNEIKTFFKEFINDPDYKITFNDLDSKVNNKTSQFISFKIYEKKCVEQKILITKEYLIIMIILSLFSVTLCVLIIINKKYNNVKKLLFEKISKVKKAAKFEQTFEPPGQSVFEENKEENVTNYGNINIF